MLSITKDPCYSKQDAWILAGRFQSRSRDTCSLPAATALGRLGIVLRAANLVLREVSRDHAPALSVECSDTTSRVFVNAKVRDAVRTWALFKPREGGVPMRHLAGRESPSGDHEFTTSTSGTLDEEKSLLCTEIGALRVASAAPHALDASVPAPQSLCSTADDNNSVLGFSYHSMSDAKKSNHDISYFKDSSSSTGSLRTASLHRSVRSLLLSDDAPPAAVPHALAFTFESKWSGAYPSHVISNKRRT